MADDGERIRIPMEALDGGATPPAADDDDGRPRVDAVSEYEKFLKSVFSGESSKPQQMQEEGPVLDSLEKLEAAGKIPPVRRFEEDGTYEERRVAASQEALAAPPQPIGGDVEAYLPVGGEAVDLKTAERMGMFGGPEEPDAEISRWDDNGGATALDEGYAAIASDRPAIRTVSAELFDALMEVFESIEAIPVEGANLSLEEFNAVMDRQSAARERVRKLLRG